jgi:hypothetical protein
MVNLSGFNEHYYLPAQDGPAARRAGRQQFLEVNPFAADENFGDAAIGWVIGRLAGTLALNTGARPFARRLHADPRHRGGGQGPGRLQVDQATTIPGLFALPKDIQDNPERLFGVQLDLYQKYFRATEVVANDNGVKAAFFLQPAIPAWGKVLTEDEKRVVGDLAYGALYRRMVAGMMVLRRARPADLRPRQHLRGREGHDLRRPDPRPCPSRRREPRQSPDGRPDG